MHRHLVRTVVKCTLKSDQPNSVCVTKEEGPVCDTNVAGTAPGRATTTTCAVCVLKGKCLQHHMNTTVSSTPRKTGTATKNERTRRPHQYRVIVMINLLILENVA